MIGGLSPGHFEIVASSAARAVVAVIAAPAAVAANISRLDIMAQYSSRQTNGARSKSRKTFVAHPLIAA
jgi:hypothetical protein